MYFGTVEACDGDILTAIQTVLQSLFIPILEKNKNWGHISGNGQISNFISNLDEFSKLLESAKANLSET